MCEQFNCQRSNLWVLSNSSCLLFTYHGDLDRQCMIHKGIIGETFQKQFPFNVKNAKQKALLYKINKDTMKEESEFVNNTLLLPVFVRTENSNK